MSAHNHREFVPGCFRCDLSRIESAGDPVTEHATNGAHDVIRVDELRAFLRAAFPGHEEETK